MKIDYTIIKQKQICTEVAQIFVDLLKKQSKVKSPDIYRIRRCRRICLVKIDDKIVGIGAIKRKTVSDFKKAKANLLQLSNDFTWELGYIYTFKAYEGNHIGSAIVTKLLDGLTMKTYWLLQKLKQTLGW